MTIYVDFVRKKHQLTVGVIGEGAVTSSTGGIAVTHNTGLQSYNTDCGLIRNLMPSPSLCYEFSH